MSTFTPMSDEQLWRALEHYLNCIPFEHNRETVRRYLEERHANGIKPATLGIDVNALRALALSLGDKKFEDATKPDVVRHLNEAKTFRSWRNVKADGTATTTVREHRLAFSTREKRKEIIRPFYRWLLGLDADDSIPQLKGIRSRANSHENVPADQLITKDELRSLLINARNTQRRAVIAVLYESGFRASEFVALNIGSVVFDQYGAVLTLPKDGPGLKTGSRRVRLFDAVSYLHAWVEEHPSKDDPRGPLWIARPGGEKVNRLRTHTLANWIQDGARRAGIKKHVHPHLFRHTAATERARMGWNEGQMRAFFGWSKNSDMPSWYVHLAGLDYENAEIERRGLKGRAPPGPALKPLVCRVCKAENPMTALFCAQCRNPVSPKAEAEIAEQKKEALKEEAARIIATLSKEDLAAIVRGSIHRPSSA
jgi:integrase/recombinase XerD